MERGCGGVWLVGEVPLRVSARLWGLTDGAKRGGVMHGQGTTANGLL
jgi:hypothetical protein